MTRNGTLACRFLLTAVKVRTGGSSIIAFPIFDVSTRFR